MGRAPRRPLRRPCAVRRASWYQRVLRVAWGASLRAFGERQVAPGRKAISAIQQCIHPPARLRLYTMYLLWILLAPVWERVFLESCQSGHWWMLPKHPLPDGRKQNPKEMHGIETKPCERGECMVSSWISLSGVHTEASREASAPHARCSGVKKVGCRSASVGGSCRSASSGVGRPNAGVAPAELYLLSKSK
jgi:hypothetical protein